MASVDYPQREPFFAHRFVRLLFKVCAAQTIGPDGVALLTCIVMTEDASHYRRPVSFFNSQLQSLLGIAKWDRLERIRKECVKAGWLCYIAPPNGARKAGHYFVTVPDFAQDLDDLPSDEGDEPYTKSGIERESTTPENGYALGYGSGVDRGTVRVSTGGTSIPVPIPNPKEPLSGPEDFETFWSVFPPGRKTKKAKTKEAWLKAIRRAKPSTIIAAAREYAASPVGRGEFVQGPLPWLNGGCWDDDRAAWQRRDGPSVKAPDPEPEYPMAVSYRKKPNAQ